MYKIFFPNVYTFKEQNIHESRISVLEISVKVCRIQTVQSFHLRLINFQYPDHNIFPLWKQTNFYLFCLPGCILFLQNDNVFLIAKLISNISVGKFLDNSVGKESTCNAGDPGWIPWPGRSLEKGQATHSSILGFPLWLRWQRIHPQFRRLGFNCWVGKIPWRSGIYPFQYSGLENSVDCIAHGVAKSQT